MEVKKAINIKSRLLGLMFKRNINYILMIPNCNGVHTFFMREKIDIVLTDRDNKILFVYKNIKPNRIILPKKGVKNTFEFPSSTTDNLKIGNYLNDDEISL